jgi:hypothetical protein
VRRIWRREIYDRERDREGDKQKDSEESFFPGLGFQTALPKKMQT